MMKASEQKILGIETEFDVGEFSNLTQEFITNRVSFMDYDFVIVKSKKCFLSPRFQRISPGFLFFLIL